MNFKLPSSQRKMEVYSASGLSPSEKLYTRIFRESNALSCTFLFFTIYNFYFEIV